MVILSAEALEDRLNGLVKEVYAQLNDDFILVGIASGGVFLAQKLKGLLESKLRRMVEMGSIDITLYRDDLYTGLEHPVLGVTDLPCSIDGKKILLVDDVLFTGRTIRSALQELNDLGRPRLIRLLVLVDRGNRELPIHADFVGFHVETQYKDRIDVQLKEGGFEQDMVLLQNA
ncbi:MAG: bifunctional pyr operon transcriptional regulator/uracil phosphoribosyltransferase PyrR [Myxococcota bacterium]|nr:bifunctional pyr operon transcriptional regulator/uracil phosphoribosyltransferase PyrR [Myxococcota bacterium]